MSFSAHWSTPGKVWFWFGMLSCSWYAWHRYYNGHSFSGTDPMVWVFAGLAAACMVGYAIFVGYVFDFGHDVHRALATPEMQENETNFVAYAKHRSGDAVALPKKRPMTRSEYIKYLEKNFPKALTAYARMGVQLERTRLMQYIDPFYNFSSVEERSEYAKKYFDFIKLYFEEYPEYEE